MRPSIVATIMAALLLVADVRGAAARHEGDQQQKPMHQERIPPTRDAVDHSRHQQPASELPPFIPPVTDEDRRAAFPDVEGHTVHGQGIHFLVLFDQLEWQSVAGGTGLNLDTKGWVGGDRDRVWFRAEGHGEGGRVGGAEAQVFYGRMIARWWDLVAGIRHDFDPGPSRTWAAFGLQGLAPYWFEVELTGYIGEGGRTHLRGEVEYELLLTNRLILQPLLEANLFGKSDPERGIGAGLSTTEMGLRLRYEYRRELAPYLGVVWSNKWGGTADLARAAGEDTSGARLVAGARIWF